MAPATVASPVALNAAAGTGAIPHNPVIPKDVQNATLQRIYAAVEGAHAEGKTGVVFIDLDLTSLLPYQRLVSDLKAVGQQFGITEFGDPLAHFESMPGYTEESWRQFIQDTHLDEKYPNLDLTSPDRARGTGGGPVYSAFRGGYWGGDWRTDQVAPGLVDFIRVVNAKGGKVEFISGRPGGYDQSIAALSAGGVQNPDLVLGQKRSGLPLPRPDVRDGDADTKYVLTKEAEARGEKVVAVVDDRASNRSAVVNAAANKDVISVAIAAPKLAGAADAVDPTNPNRISSFAILP